MTSPMNRTNTSIVDTNRHFVVLVDFRNCNPQGDPDMENAPRTDALTRKGLITAQGPKRKIRDALEQQGMPLYVTRDSVLKSTTEEIERRLNLVTASASDKKGGGENSDGEDTPDEAASNEADPEASVPTPKKSKGKGKSADKVTPDQVRVNQEAVYQEMARKFVDVRMFGQLVPRYGVRPLTGPVQFSMGESIDPVVVQQMSITRCAVEAEGKGANKTMGDIKFISYGLYRIHVFVNASKAKRTLYTEADHQLLVQSILRMYDDDASSVRNQACVRLLVEVQEVEGRSVQGVPFGMPMLERLVRVSKKDPDGVPASYDDYLVEVDTTLVRSTDVKVIPHRGYNDGAASPVYAS